MPDNNEFERALCLVVVGREEKDYHFACSPRGRKATAVGEGTPHHSKPLIHAVSSYVIWN